MRKFIVWAILAIALLTVPALAQSDDHGGTAAGQTATGTAAAHSGSSWVFPAGLASAWLGAAIGTGLIVMGAARGIGNIGSSAVEAIARQPEAGGQIFTSMLLSAALIEGFTLFGVVVTLLIVLKTAA